MGQEAIVRCHCGQLNITARLRDEIPVGGLLCHCNLCRHVTGALTFSGVALVDPPVEAFTTKLIKYATSEKIDRYFCPTCGSHVCYRTNKVKDTPWHACSGCIDEVIGGDKFYLEKYDGHEFIIDTLDGGLAFTLPDVPMYTEADNVPPVSDMRKEIARWKGSLSRSTSQERINARCQCGQVEFDVLRPENGGKWDTEVCACRSCRLSFGQPITAWALTLPYDRVVWKDGTVHDGSAHTSIRRFRSSERADRDFCPKCGATIFYYSLINRPRTVDVAIGILRAEEGVLAKSFLKWNTDSVGFIEDAVDKSTLDILQHNLPALDEV